MIALAALLAVTARPQDDPVVTATQWVGVGKSGKEQLRKINGRWWTRDNREVYPPKQHGLINFWTVDSKPGVTRFYHHRPFDLGRAEWLHLWMKPREVERLLGPPNRVFPSVPKGDPCQQCPYVDGFWYYYAVDGTAVDIRFMDGELGEAKYRGKSGTRPVASVAQELNGRSIYKLRAERNARNVGRLSRTPAEAPPPHRSSRLSRSPTPAIMTVEVPGSQAPAPPPQKRVIAPDALAQVKIADSRERVLTLLGEPSHRMSIQGDDGVQETLTYHLEDGSPVSIRLINGKVTQLSGATK